MEHFETVVLGGGPVGMALGAIYKCPVITEKVRVPEGPVFLYATPQTEDFLYHYCGMGGIMHPLPRKNVSIGFSWRGKIFNDPPEEALAEYSKKVRKPEVYHPASFYYFDVDWAKVIEAERRMVPSLVLDKAEKIDVEHQRLTLSSMDEISYGTLISTIPAPLFAHLAGFDWDLKYLGIWLMDYRIDTPEWLKYDYVYICDSRDVKLRWTKGKVIQENGTLEKLTLRKPNQYRILDGKIPDVPNVKFMGRFARWEESRLISDDIAEAMNEPR